MFIGVNARLRELALQVQENKDTFRVETMEGITQVLVQERRSDTKYALLSKAGAQRSGKGRR